MEPIRECVVCGNRAVLEVKHSQFGVRMYCREHFMRTLHVPPGSAVRWI
jgi:hypothetical protein